MSVTVHPSRCAPLRRARRLRAATAAATFVLGLMLAQRRVGARKREGHERSSHRSACASGTRSAEGGAESVAAVRVPARVREWEARGRSAAAAATTAATAAVETAAATAAAGRAHVKSALALPAKLVDGLASALPAWRAVGGGVAQREPWDVDNWGLTNDLSASLWASSHRRFADLSHGRESAAGTVASGLSASGDGATGAGGGAADTSALRAEVSGATDAVQSAAR